MHLHQQQQHLSNLPNNHRKTRKFLNQSPISLDDLLFVEDFQRHLLTGCPLGDGAKHITQTERQKLWNMSKISTLKQLPNATKPQLEIAQFRNYIHSTDPFQPMSTPSPSKSKKIRRSQRSSKVSPSISKIYYDIHHASNPDEWDYERLKIKFGDQSNYTVSKKLGRGKYSEVFLGYNTKTNTDCVIKILKPVKLKKIFREIKALFKVQNFPYTVKLIDILRDSESKTISLVFEYLENVDARSFLPTLSTNDLAYYFYLLLSTLNDCHSVGIMHRDVKPQNLIINPKTGDLRLIDWGLAEFYHPGFEYNVRVASKCYKGPELLVNKHDYDYSLDIWSLGALFGGILFRKEPFFHGKDNNDQLVKISKVLGTKGLSAFLKKYSLVLPPVFTGLITKSRRIPWEEFISDNTPAVTPLAIDFLDKCLKYDPEERITPKDAMGHPFFDTVKKNGIDQLIQEKRKIKLDEQNYILSS